MASDESPDSVGLSYVDLLYALPVAAIANLIVEVHSSEVTVAGWFNVGLALTAVTCGWVGHHGNRKLMPKCLRQQEEKWFFTTPRFLQFILEILVIAVYFALVLAAQLPDPDGSGGSFEITLTKLLAIGFGLYLVWDLLDIWIASGSSRRSLPCQASSKWLDRAIKGMVVTLVFGLVFGVICAYVWAGHHLTRHIAWFDAGLIVLLVIYRMVQEIVCGGGFRARWTYT